MQNDKMKNILAVVLVFGLGISLWVRYSADPGPYVEAPQTAAVKRTPAVPAKVEHKAGKHALKAPAMYLRDPFQGKRTASNYIDSDYRRLNISMIGIAKRSSDSFARINGRILHTGSTIRGYRIIAIRKNGVYVQRPGEKRHFIRIL